MRGGDLPVSIDYPREPRSSRRRLMLPILLVVLAVIVFGTKTALSYWVDLLWFRSLGFGDVFWKTWSMQWGIFVAFAAATFVILFGAYSALKRAHQDDLPRDHTIIFGGQPVKLSVEPVLRIAALVISLGIAAVTGASMMDEWPTLSLWWYTPSAGSGVADPIFGKPLSFFLFTLPAWHLILGWLLTLSVMCCVLTIFFLVITGAFRALDKGRNSYFPAPWRGLSITVAFLLVILAIEVYLDRFDRLLEHHTIFDGITYTDAHLMLTGLLIVCAALILGAVIAAINAVRRPRGTIDRK